MKKTIATALALVLSLTMLSSCGEKKQEINEKLDTKEQITLTVCGPWTVCKAIETASQSFYEKYPNCEIKYEYVENYEESILNRLQSAPDTIDLFLTENIQSGSAKIDYVEELFSHPELDLSDTNDALIKNFTFITTDKEAERTIYSLPLGGELRGMFVNKTLLESLGLEVPENIDELMSCCEKLKEADYIPLGGNPGIFAQRLMYPYVCNLVANSDDYEATYNKVNSCEEGVSEIFREPMQVLYNFTSNYYYNYKAVETDRKMFIDSSNEGMARDFFNVLDNGNGFEKIDDTGVVAFMPATLSQTTTMEKIKEDYHSEIDYEFILSPVSKEGGFAYVSPSKGIAVNKNGVHKDWSIEFLNYIMTKEVNTQLAEDINFIPNTKDSFGFIADQYNVSADRISDLGQSTYDYAFYNIIEKSLVEIAKGNNPKYMDTDEDGNSVMFSFEYFMEKLEGAFAEQRNGGAQNDESKN